MAEIVDIINVSQEIMWGTPVFKGTRVPVKALFDYLRKGHSVDEFLEDFPTVGQAQVLNLLDLAGSEILSNVAVDANIAR